MTKRFARAVLLLVALALAPLAQGQPFTITWDPPAVDSGITGFNVYVESDVETSASLFDVGLQNSFDVPVLDPNGHYLVFVTARNSEGAESDSSNLLELPADSPCFISLSSRQVFVDAWGGSNNVFAAASAACSITAVTDASWITILPGEPAGGRTRISFSVDENPYPAPREASINIGEQLLIVSQSAGGPLPPLITRHLSAVASLVIGEPFDLKVELRDSTGISFQWYKEGLPISNATNATFHLDSPSAEDAGSYSVGVENSVEDVFEGPVHVLIGLPPRIIQQPFGSLVSLGDPVGFGIYAVGTNLQYSWTKDGILLTNTLPILFIQSVQNSDLGAYQAIISNDAGTVYSDIIYVTTLHFEEELGRVRIGLLSSQGILVEGEGIPGATYDIQSSHDLIHWDFVDSVVVDEGGLFRVDAPVPQDEPAGRWFVRTLRKSSPGGD